MTPTTIPMQLAVLWTKSIHISWIAPRKPDYAYTSSSISHGRYAKRSKRSKIVDIPGLGRAISSRPEGGGSAADKARDKDSTKPYDLTICHIKRLASLELHAEIFFANFERELEGLLTGCDLYSESQLQGCYLEA